MLQKHWGCQGQNFTGWLDSPCQFKISIILTTIIMQHQLLVKEMARIKRKKIGKIVADLYESETADQIQITVNADDDYFRSILKDESMHEEGDKQGLGRSKGFGNVGVVGFNWDWLSLPILDPYKLTLMKLVHCSPVYLSRFICAISLHKEDGTLRAGEHMTQTYS